MALRLSAAIVLVFLILALPMFGFAQGPARLYLQVPLQDEKQLVVNVMLANVADLYGAEIQLRYDPAQLQVEDANSRLEGVQIAPGPFLAAQDRFVVTNRVDTQSGLITFVVTLLNPAPPVSGSGVLATIAFKVVGGGSGPVEVTKAQLVSSDMKPLPVITENLPLPTATASAPVMVPSTGVQRIPVWGWWAIGLSALLLAFIVVVSFGLKRHGAAVPPVSRGGALSASAHTPSETAAILAQQAKRAMDRGDFQLARELFSRAVEQDPANSEAWLGKGLVAQQVAEKRICFQRVLALDPNNPVAQVELQQMAGSH
jgi:hypothetical protein